MLTSGLLIIGVMVSGDVGTAAPWRAARTVDGLKVERRDVKNSAFEELKVSTQSTRPLAALCDAVWGRDAKVEGDFKKRVIIRETESDRWTYEQVHVPVVKDRDCVMHAQLLAAAGTGRCEVAFESGADPSWPRRNDHVRVGAVRGRWTLEPDADGKVAVTYVIYSEPGGGVPAWLARGGQVDAAVAFMKTILSRAGK